jgi:bacterioferritin
MEGNDKVIAALQAGLAKEAHLNLQCRLNQRTLAYLGLGTLAKKIKAHGDYAHEYMKQVTKRILFLEGNPSYQIAPIVEQASVTELLKNLLALNLAIVAPYEDAVAVATAAKDDTTRNLFEHLLKWHQEDICWLEKQVRLIGTLGEATYISTKV